MKTWILTPPLPPTRLVVKKSLKYGPQAHDLHTAEINLDIPVN